MNAHTPPPFTTPADPTAEHAAWAEGVLRRQSAVLEQLSEAGLRMAQAIERQAGEGDEALPPAEAAMAFARAARAVRMAALLQSRIVRELGQIASRAAVQAEQALEAERAAAEAAEAEADPAYGHKARVEAIVARVARAQAEDGDHADRLVRETAERLDDDDIYGDVLIRPIGELVSLICRDLGLEPDWGRLALEAWAKAEADDPRSPFHSTPLPKGRQADTTSLSSDSS